MSYKMIDHIKHAIKNSSDNFKFKEEIKNSRERKLIQSTLCALVELKKGFKEKSFSELIKFLHLFSKYLNSK